MPEAANNKSTPPYLPYRTFLGSFDRLAEGVPPRIDRGIWKNQTGTVQSLIMGAYRFFGLINEQSQPTQRLHDLVAHRDPEGGQQLRAQIAQWRLEAGIRYEEGVAR